jgi:putative toxin-antitoxin system antitoxin component (TIGR02293 family)
MPINYNYSEEDMDAMRVEEPQTLYLTEPQLQQYSISRFEALQARVSFSQAEWAAILNVSLKTLQRYLKQATPFMGLQAEHLQQVNRLIVFGISIFGTGAALEAWLRQPKTVLGKPLSFSALQSFWGTRLLEDEIGRMAHGVYV